MTANSTFITRDERIDMSYWAQGLLGSVATDLVAEMCVGEKCLN
jgi:hypothetical protein